SPRDGRRGASATGRLGTATLPAVIRVRGSRSIRLSRRRVARGPEVHLREYAAARPRRLDGIVSSILPTWANHFGEGRGVVELRVTVCRKITVIIRHSPEHSPCEGNFPVGETLAAPGEENRDRVCGVDDVPADGEEVLDQFHRLDVRH